MLYLKFGIENKVIQAKYIQSSKEKAFRTCTADFDNSGIFELIDGALQYLRTQGVLVKTEFEDGFPEDIKGVLKEAFEDHNGLLKARNPDFYE